MTIHPDRTPTLSERLHPDSASALDRRSLPSETIERLLDSDRRCEALRCVLAADEPIAVRTLVARLADAEHDATIGTTIHQLRQRVHVSLCRTHLPLLEENDVVAYDRVRNLVGPAANLFVFDSLLETESLDRSIASRLDCE